MTYICLNMSTNKRACTFHSGIGIPSTITLSSKKGSNCCKVLPISNHFATNFVQSYKHLFQKRSNAARINSQKTSNMPLSKVMFNAIFTLHPRQHLNEVLSPRQFRGIVNVRVLFYQYNTCIGVVSTTALAALS